MELQEFLQVFPGIGSGGVCWWHNPLFLSVAVGFWSFLQACIVVDCSVENKLGNKEIVSEGFNI